MLYPLSYGRWHAERVYKVHSFRRYSVVRANPVSGDERI